MAGERSIRAPLARLLERFVKIEPRELHAVLAAFCLLFFVLGGYFAVRPVRETIGTVLGDSATSRLWTWTAVFAIAIVPIYGWLLGRVRRALLLPLIYLAVAVALAASGAILQFDPNNPWIARTFYVGISVINLLLVSVFWSFLLELFASEQTKRLFGFIAAGGTTGALVGPLLTERFVTSLGNAGILYFGALMFLIAIICQLVLLRSWQGIAAQSAAGGKLQTGTNNNAGNSRDGEPRMAGNPFSGFALVFASPYLLAIVSFVVLISTANTLLYFEQLRLVSGMFSDLAERTQMLRVSMRSCSY
jgi:AAA family ATP:ADP antiporter